MVVSDPLNGSMYATAMYGADMLFRDLQREGREDRCDFRQTENAFASATARR